MMPELDPLEMIAGVDGPRPTTSLRARRRELASPLAQRAILAQASAARSDGVRRTFAADLASAGWKPLRPSSIEFFQINLGKLCNMTCRHCHVDAGPDRAEEVMDRETVDACLLALDRTEAHTVDLTGGAPELNPHFEYAVEASLERGKHVIDRCNLTILTTARFAHLPRWFAERGVEVVCSLPHYRPLGTDAQRGNGAFARSIEALRALNEVGYGHGDPRRRLVLVTNPTGAFLAGSQESREAEWKKALRDYHGVTFDALHALNNMPVSRFLEWLVDGDRLDTYMSRLVNAFNPATVAGLMCRNTLSVSWDGYLFDCDFNQMLDIPAALGHSRTHVAEFDPAAWSAHPISTGPHCYGCTAGAGSSCSGEIVTRDASDA